MSRRSSTEKVDIEIVDTKPDHVESKPQVIEIGTFRVVGISQEDADYYRDFPEDRRKKVFRKVRRIYYNCQA